METAGLGLGPVQDRPARVLPVLDQSVLDQSVLDPGSGPGSCSPAVLAVDEEDEEEFLCEPEPLLLSCSGSAHWWLGKLRPPEARRRLLRSGVGGLHRAKECDSAPFLEQSPPSSAGSPDPSVSSTRVLRAALSSTVLRRAGGERPLPLLVRRAVLEETRGRKRGEVVHQQGEPRASLAAHLVLERRPPALLEEMLDSEAQRRRGSSRRGAAESSSPSVRPLAPPGQKRTPLAS